MNNYVKKDTWSKKRGLVKGLKQSTDEINIEMDLRWLGELAYLGYTIENAPLEAIAKAKRIVREQIARETEQRQIAALKAGKDVW